MDKNIVRFVLVVNRRSYAHHLNSSEIDSHTPVPFLNRFEKQYLDSDVLKMVGINPRSSSSKNNKQNSNSDDDHKDGVNANMNMNEWQIKYQRFENKLMQIYKDHYNLIVNNGKSGKLSVFVGFDSKQTIISLLIAQNTINIKLKQEKKLEKRQAKKAAKKEKEKLKRLRKQQAKEG